MSTIFHHVRDTYVQTESGHVYKTSRECVSSRDKIIGAAKAKKILRERALRELREILKPGDTVHGIVRSVARSGMSRRIDFYKLVDSDKLYLTGRFAHVLETDDFDNGLRVSGCGMDMIFATVYSISRALWPEGAPCTGDRATCHSNDHSNGDRAYDATKVHRDGGYALRHAQL